MSADRLLERDTQVGAIANAVDAAEAGTGRLVVLDGPPGIGKSTLLERASALARARGFEVLSARGSELESDFAFGVAVQAFESTLRDGDQRRRSRLLGGSAGLAAPLLEGATLDVPAAEGDRGFPLVHGLYWLASNLAQERPLLFAVDDAHWSDRASLRFLLYLSERLEHLPIVVVAGARLREPRASQDLLARLKASHAAVNLPLPPLSVRGVFALVRDALPEAGDDVARACAELTGGNPFLVRELVHALRAGSDDGAGLTVDSVRRLVPDPVMRAVVVRLCRLPDAAGRLARAASVLGSEAALGRAAALADVAPSDAGRAADTLVHAEIMRRGEPLSFVHPLIRSSVYSDVAPAERAVLHVRAARMLHTDDAPPERVAEHLLVGHRTGEPWAVDALHEAARRAAGRHAPASAIEYLSRALDEGPDHHRRGRLLADLGHAEALEGRESAVARFEEAVEVLDEPGERARARLGLGRALHRFGRRLEAAETFRHAMDDVGDGEPGLRDELEAGWLSIATTERGLLEQARVRLASFLERTELRAGTAQRGVLAALAAQQAFIGAPKDRCVGLALRAYGDGALLAELTSESEALYMVTAVLWLCDELDKDVEILGAALEDARRRGSIMAFAAASSRRSWPFLLEGRLADAIADAQHAIDARRRGWETWLPAAYTARALAELEHDQIERAYTSCAQAESTTRATFIDGPMIDAARGRIHLEAGCYAEAMADCLKSGRRFVEEFSVQTPTVAPWRSDAALAAAHLGREDEARRLSGEELEISRHIGAPRVVGMSLRAAGLVRGGDEGVALLDEAVETLKRSPSRLELARALIDLGAAIRRTGARARAREPLSQGLALAKEFGAHRLARRARDELLATGESAGRRTLSGVGSLTPGELRVARRAAEGRTNREIAEELFVTVKAVEGQLRGAYRKLEIASRAELPAVLGEAEPAADPLRQRGPTTASASARR